MQYSRQVEDSLAFQHNGKLQKVLQQRCDVNPARTVQDGSGGRVGLTASVVGSRKCVMRACVQHRTAHVALHAHQDRPGHHTGWLFLAPCPARGILSRLLLCSLDACGWR